MKKMSSDNPVNNLLSKYFVGKLKQQYKYTIQVKISQLVNIFEFINMMFIMYTSVEIK